MHVYCDQTMSSGKTQRCLSFHEESAAGPTILLVTVNLIGFEDWIAALTTKFERNFFAKSPEYLLFLARLLKSKTFPSDLGSIAFAV